MPGLNRTGPMGNGPMTGGGRGLCNSTNQAGTVPAYGGGYGAGFGRGMGFSRGFRANRGGMGRRWEGMENSLQNQPVYNITASDELNALKSEATSIKSTLENINKKITELEKTL